MPNWVLAMHVLFLLPHGTSASDVTENKPELIVITAEEGESVNITCKFDQLAMSGLRLRRTLVKAMDVLYVKKQGLHMTKAPEYAYRMEYFQLKNASTIMLKHVKKNDSDGYLCGGTLIINQEPRIMNFSTIILAVKEASAMKLTECPSFLWVPYILIFMSLLLLVGLGYFILSHIDIKKCCNKGKAAETQNMVYEDMTCSLRRNTMNNVYNN
ncbi:T-cell antigen CD7 [Podarcis lilfordi]|uniref:T-cell antigen CD7 n=1 Tax=Podarcis lilfordi TaxID=74358 RepID=A0AA35NYW7_9SAUR|nr:T-cell antigen CD7 [Podarcis lilfordi]